ncbi:Soluble lytic murein transglycosylase precursor, partial [hydrothermal vent metagenome]
MRPSNKVYCFIAAFSLLLSGCATTAQNNSSEHSQSNQRMTASAIYSVGKEAMNIGDHQAAIRHFNTLITQYPVDKFALQGQLELAYAYHKIGQSSSTIATTERFINNHPQHKNSDYAYYL